MLLLHVLEYIVLRALVYINWGMLYVTCKFVVSVLVIAIDMRILQ